MPDKYYAYEIDRYAVQTATHNFPQIEELGNVFDADFSKHSDVDFLIGGSPCTYWSIAQHINRETVASGLGWELFSQYVRAIHEARPKYFIYENNKSMSDAIRKSISDSFGFEPVCINSAFVSAQTRQRLYWVGKRNRDGSYSRVDVPQPDDKMITLIDVLEPLTAEKGYALAQPGKPLSESEMDYMVRQIKDGRNHFDFGYFQNGTRDKSACITANIHKGVPYNVLAVPVRIGTIENKAKNKAFDSQAYRVYSPYGKSINICGNGGGIGAKTGLYATPVVVSDNDYSYPVYEVKNGFIHVKDGWHPIHLPDGLYVIRKLTVTECKRLQTVPDWFEFPVSNTQAYKMLGNGWTVDVIAHLISQCVNSYYRFGVSKDVYSKLISCCENDSDI